jgi:hypothetical protein
MFCYLEFSQVRIQRTAVQPQFSYHLESARIETLSGDQERETCISFIYSVVNTFGKKFHPQTIECEPLKNSRVDPQNAVELM